VIDDWTSSTVTMSDRPRYPEKCPHCGRTLKVVMPSSTTMVYEVCAICGGRI